MGPEGVFGWMAGAWTEGKAEDGTAAVFFAGIGHIRMPQL